MPFVRAAHGRTHKRVVLVVGAQMGKTEGILDLIGERLDSSPVPIIYVGPSQQFIREQFEPRIMDLLDEAPALSRKVGRGQKNKKTRKVISGVPLRLAHGGSSTALKSDPFGMALTDEADELLANVRKAGNPIELIDLRGSTYGAGFVHAIVSTPSEGPADVTVDADSGLEFWANTDRNEVASTIWQLWLSGTRYHWSWPCPHCGEYFIPRFRCLAWDKPKDDAGREQKSTPHMAGKTAHLVCPRNGCVITDDAKAWMNERGVYVAPGQSVTPDGVVEGLEPESWTISYWVSGLASPFVSWGERAAAYVNAVRSGDHEQIKVVVNGGFGELYVPGDGDVPEWAEVQKLGETAEAPYHTGQAPEWVQAVTMAVDVQKNRLIFTKRGWGAYGTSCLIEAGEIFGDTSEEHIWNDLASEMTEYVYGMPIRLVLIDSGFRPGKKDAVPDHRVYEFCRRFPNLARATKGSSTPMRKPIVASQIDIKLNGREFKKGLHLLRLDGDHFKSAVHAKVRWPEGAPGAFYLPTDVSEDYCMQLVSEARVKTPNGKVKWVQRARENHFLDIEAMQEAAGMLLNVRTLRGETPQKPRRMRQDGEYAPPETIPDPDNRDRDRRPERRQGWLPRESIWR